ncbi:MAG: hypothetical protein IKH15_04575 [Bacteroidales bacterium]|nr:hypothetical protein [Prevotella sp.]MBR3466475.1 hypothetical protein [Bacteroidales bacterium]
MWLKNYKKKRLYCFVFIIMLFCANTRGQSATVPQTITWSLLKVDSLLYIKNIQEIKLLHDELYITYEFPGGYGDQLLKSYSINWETRTMHFTKEYYKRKNGTYVFSVPITFWDENGKQFVTERSHPYIYEVRKDTLRRNGEAIISSKSECPYELVLEVKNPFIFSKGKYFFVGRQEKNGHQAIFSSTTYGDQQKIEELYKIIYDKRYPSWLVNHGMFTYCPSEQKGAFAYQLFPAVDFFNFSDGTTKIFKKGLNTFNPKTINEGDIWESNPIHFKYITSNKKYVYCLYWGLSVQRASQKEKQHTFRAEILILNWDGEIYKTFRTTRKITAMAVSEDGKHLIGYDGKNFLMTTI